MLNQLLPQTSMGKLLSRFRNTIVHCKRDIGNTEHYGCDTSFELAHDRVYAINYFMYCRRSVVTNNFFTTIPVRNYRYHVFRSKNQEQGNIMLGTIVINQVMNFQNTVDHEATLRLLKYQTVFNILLTPPKKGLGRGVNLS